MKILAVIPARGGSKRLPRKNIYPLCGRPLISYAIEACKNSKIINADNVYVSTEDDEIASVSQDLGVNVIDRPLELSQDHVWTQDVLSHALEYTESLTGSRFLRRVARSLLMPSRRPNRCAVHAKFTCLWSLAMARAEPVSGPVT